MNATSNTIIDPITVMSNTDSVSNINSLICPTRSNGHTSSNSESFIIPSAPRRIARKLKQLESIVSPLTDTIDYTTSTAVSPSTVDYITSTILLSSTVIEPTQNISTTCDDYYYYSLCSTTGNIYEALVIFVIIIIVIFSLAALFALLYIGVLTIIFIIVVCCTIWQHVMKRQRLRSTERNADSTNQEGTCKLIIILMRSIHHNKSSRSRNGDKFCYRGTRYYNQYS